MIASRKNNYITLLLIAVVSIGLVGCSTQKNTKGSRAFHQFTTRYNVYFNANTLYKNGQKAIEKNQKDDFTNIIPMFPISNHDNVTVATNDMDNCIEKCRKAIKNHSITKKPKRDPKKLGDPKYKLFLSQDEYVPGVCQAWITLGKAEFHKGDFMGAVGTFSYIIKHYPNHRETTTEARLWLVRAYGELGWNYEAEQALSQINENDVTRSLTGLYAETKSYIFLMNKQYAEAIPFLKMAADKSKNRYQTTRYYYILAQIYQELGKKNEAIEYYSRVNKMNPSYLMEFNAELQSYQLEAGHNPKAIKGLEKMAKNVNNANFKDQIYYAIGNSYLERNDTTRALKAYQKGVDESTRNGMDKAILLIQMGDLYYEQKEYVKAEPCFSDAALILSSSHEDFARVSRINENLSELVTLMNSVHLQDSLQYLSTLSESQQREIVDKIIKQVIADEEEAKKKAQEEKDIALANTPSGGASNINGNKTGSTVGGGIIGGSTEWYFYNPTLIAGGKSQFQQKWGARKLEDNWRRQNKTTLTENEEDEEPDDDLTADGSTPNDTTTNKNNKEGSDDNKNPNFYLSQIPTTEAEIARSNKTIAQALYSMGELFASKLADYEMATQTFAEFQRRFPEDAHKLESYYYCYQLYGKQGDSATQNSYREKIVSEFPTSNYALMLSQPDYADKVREMYALQDSIYKSTYQAYSQSEFSTVFVNYNRMMTDYPMSPLMPKFTFLNALSLGKSTSDTALYNALEILVADYPKSDVTAMAKDILALRKQGLTATQGTAHGDLLTKRAEDVAASQTTTTQKLSFKSDARTPHLFVMVPKSDDTETLNTLLYDLAAYNFTKFMIKEFDIEVSKNEGKHYVVVSGFDNLDEAKWYESGLMSEPLFQGRVTLDVCDRYVISTDNMKLIGNLTWDEYKKFLEQENQKTSKKTK